MEKANNLLRQAGYYEERRVDISDILEMYEKYGYHCNDAQEAFMAHYAGLEIHYNHPMWNQDILLRLDPIKAQSMITMDVVEEYMKFLQDDLLIIGDIEREHMTLFYRKRDIISGHMMIAL